MLRTSILLIVTALLTCCTSGNFLGQSRPLQVHSLGPQQKLLDCSSPIAASMPSDSSEGELWITNIPLDLLGSGNLESEQIIRNEVLWIIQMQVLWIPSPGKTPLVSTSTNMTIKQIIIAEDGVGVYVGGGFGWPTGSPENGMSINMEDATLVLQSSRGRFVDALKPAATMVGFIHAPADATLVRKISACAARYSNN